MFEARLNNPIVLRKILDSLRELIEEANIEVNESGLSLQAMDSSHVSLVAMHLKASGFEKFDCSGSSTLGVNLGAIQKIMKCGSNDDSLTLKSNEEAAELKLQFESSNSERYFEYSMSLMDIESEHLAIPDVEHESCVAMPSGEFQKICRDLAQLGDSAKISVTSKSVSFGIAGDSGSGSYVFNSYSSATGDSFVDIQCEENVELSFALRYLNFFTKSTPLASQVKLYLSPERPLLVEYEMDDDLGYMKYYLAPKLEGNDEE